MLLRLDRRSVGMEPLFQRRIEAFGMSEDPVAKLRRRRHDGLCDRNLGGANGGTQQVGWFPFDSLALKAAQRQELDTPTVLYNSSA